MGDKPEEQMHRWLPAGTSLCFWQRRLSSASREPGCSEQHVFSSQGQAMCTHQKLLAIVNFSLLKEIVLDSFFKAGPQGLP